MIYGANFPPQIDSQLKLSDGLFLDLSGKGNTITNNGATLTTDHRGRANKAFDLVAASSQHITLPNTLIRNKTALSVSFGYRKKVASEVIRPLVIYLNTSDTAFVAIGVDRIVIIIGTTANEGRFLFTQDTNWHYATLIFNGAGATNADRLKLVLDGVERTLSFSGTIPATTPDTDRDLYIGRLASSYENSQYDYNDIAHRAISISEAQQLYHEWRK